MTVHYFNRKVGLELTIVNEQTQNVGYSHFHHLNKLDQLPGLNQTVWTLQIH